MAQAIQTPEQQTYLARLLGYDFNIQYHAGTANSAADALSGELLMLTIPSCIFLQDLKDELRANQEFLNFKQRILDDPQTHPDCIWLPRNAPSIPTILAEFHSTPTGGHMGMTKTLARVRDNFTWANMQQDVHKYIANCVPCQQTKYDHRCQSGLLCPLPIPARPWEDLSLDFIVGLSNFRGHSVILVVVDRFSKGVHLGMLSTHYTAANVVTTFMEIAGKLHDIPQSLVSGRDPLFISRFWQELFKLSGTKLCMSSAYHPQTDGQTEVMNHVIEQYLRAFVHQRLLTWGHHLIWAEWSYNTLVHYATGMSPYEVTFGKKPPSLPQYLAGTSTIEAVEECLTNRDQVFASLARKLNKA